jgi:hypothetical protein
MTQPAVLAAADRLINAFFRHETAAYFRAFSPDASFIFHNVNRRLENRADYQALWAQWEREDGFRVTGGRSSNRSVSLHGRIAIFSHDVLTELNVRGEPRSNHERETIVFEEDASSGAWVAIHEHLSPAPAEAA